MFPGKSKQQLPGSFFAGMKRRTSSTTTSSSAAPRKNNHSKINSGASPSAHKNPKNRSSVSHNEHILDIAQYSNVLSPSGAEIINYFPELSLEPPNDANLRLLWDRMCDEHVASRVLRLNRRLVTQELKKNNLKYSPVAMRAMEPILRRQVLFVYSIQCLLVDGRWMF